MPEIHVLILCEISEAFVALVDINLYQSPYLFGLIVFDLSMPFQTIHIFYHFLSSFIVFPVFLFVLPLRHGSRPGSLRLSNVFDLVVHLPKAIHDVRTSPVVAGTSMGNLRSSYDP